MTRIEMKSKVGRDGVLKVAVPMVEAEANRQVNITVESVEPVPSNPSVSPAKWRQFIKEVAGSIWDPTFKRHEQGECDERAEILH